MTELEKFQLVNNAATIEQLQEAIRAIAEDGEIQGKSKKHRSEHQAYFVTGVVKGTLNANALTRSYGIRQQAIYLQYYKKYEMSKTINS